MACGIVTESVADLQLIQALGIAFAVSINVAMADYGLDRHMWDIPQEVLPATFKTYILAKTLFTLASSFIRMSLLCFYLWLVRDLGSRVLRWTIFACIIGNGLMCLVFCLVTIFPCRYVSTKFETALLLYLISQMLTKLSRPVSAFWTFPRPEDAVCLDDSLATAIMGGFLCLADFIVNALPLPIVVRLNMPVRQRASIGVLLSLGAVATLAGVVRELWIYKSLIATEDHTYEALPLWICADVEIYVALLCACGPALKPLYAKLHRRTSEDGGFVRRKASSDQVYWGSNDLESRLHRNIYAGGLVSNITHICHMSNEHLPTIDRVISGKREAESTVSPLAIQVVTHIELQTTSKCEIEEVARPP